MRAPASIVLIACVVTSCALSETDGPYGSAEKGPVELVSSVPAGGDFAFDPAREVFLEFNRELNPDSVEVALADGAGKGIPIEAIAEENLVTVTAPLEFETSYVLRVAQAKDIYGNVLAGAPIEIRFGTVADGSIVTTTFADVAPIFRRSCTDGCHEGSKPEGGLSLEPSKAYDQLVGVLGGKSCIGSRTRVKPFDPNASCLWRLVKSGAMPDDGPPLPISEKEVIRQWILDGALRE
ncbi:MAG TPA: Ig-like domain-containing protein [Vulgatibacter sp.]